MPFSCQLENELSTVSFGGQIAQAIGESGACIYLLGDLGAGKTTLSRGIIRAYGHLGSVKSPTYTLVEPYELADKTIYHFDLYRLADPAELEFLGVQDYFLPSNLCLVEWPEKGGEFLPKPDIKFVLSEIDSAESSRRAQYDEDGNVIVARTLSFEGCSSLGVKIVNKLNEITGS